MIKEELEKEAEEWLCNNLHSASEEDFIKAMVDIAEPREKRISELEKENAELKETLKTYNGCGDWDNDFHTCRVYLQHEELQKYVEKLTKAKEIIRTFLGFAEAFGYSPSMDKFITEAEQFLKE